VLNSEWFVDIRNEEENKEKEKERDLAKSVASIRASWI
jgi:hypothetical protein